MCFLEGLRGCKPLHFCYPLFGCYPYNRNLRQIQPWSTLNRSPPCGFKECVFVISQRTLVTHEPKIYKRINTMMPNNSRNASRIVLLAFIALTWSLATELPQAHAETSAQTAETPPKPRAPNIIIIFADDHGYADLGSFGAEGFDTPHLDRMAAEGIRLTSFYVAQATCSASRAALLTGYYPNRIGITGALDHRATHGLNPNELTIAEVLIPVGYATAAVGKWHLGHQAEFLPTRQGFQEYFGLPYSNDMWPSHPATPNFYPALPLLEGETVIATNPDQAQLTTWYTERAVQFIERQKDHPFFLYLAHSMPHVPLFVSDRFQGKTPRGLYGDVVAEIDWSVGQVLATLKRLGLDEQTLVIFASDNGPWTEYGDHAGSAQPLRGGKRTAFEGGVRVPFIARWPHKIPPGLVSHMPAMTIDVLPTIAHLAGTRIPDDRIIDGRDIWPLLAGAPDAKEPHEALYFYWGHELHAIRSGPWKLHLPHPYADVIERGSGGQPGRTQQNHIGLSLFDLEQDVGETRNVADQHPDIVARLMRFAASAREDLGDALTKSKGKNLRPAGKLRD